MGSATGSTLEDSLSDFKFTGSKSNHRWEESAGEGFDSSRSDFFIKSCGESGAVEKARRELLSKIKCRSLIEWRSKD